MSACRAFPACVRFPPPPRPAKQPATGRFYIWRMRLTTRCVSSSTILACFPARFSRSFTASHCLSLSHPLTVSHSRSLSHFLTVSHSRSLSHSHTFSHLTLACRGTSLIRISAPVGPYSRTMPRTLQWSWGRGGCFLFLRYPCNTTPAAGAAPRGQ